MSHIYNSGFVDPELVAHVMTFFRFHNVTQSVEFLDVVNVCLWGDTHLFATIIFIAAVI